MFRAAEAIWSEHSHPGHPRACPPAEDELAAWRSVWHAGTEQARRRTREVRLDLSYGRTANERLDLYPVGHRPGRVPFVAFVNGWEWRHAMREEAGFPAKAMHRHGAAFIAVGFDPVPAVGLSTQVEQVRRAWRYLLDNAERLGLDPARGHLVGHGSGAHLAALAALEPDGLAPAGAVLVSGVYDLEPVRRSPLGATLGLGARAVAEMSPVHRIPGAAPPLTVVWGERETPAGKRQGEDFVRACRARGLRVRHGALPGRNHLGSSLELADPASRVLDSLRGPR